MNNAHGRAIAADTLVKTYPGGVRALDGLSLTVAPGEVFGLLGQNGAGKSTTVKILTTLARADSGSAQVAGYDVAAQPDRVRRAIGVVSQRSGADPSATGRENLMLQGRQYGLGGADLRHRVGELVDRFDLAEVVGRMVKTYSGGTRRRLDVALGLVHRPRVLFLDEPTTGLDPEVRAAIWAEITRLAAEDGVAVLLTTHYLDEADRLADRLAIVDRGRVVAAGSPDGLKGELRGDAVHLELREPPDERAVRAALAPVGAVTEITVEGTRLHTRAEDGAGAVPAVLAALDAAGLAVASVTVARPSLDDVYLRHAGRRFGQDPDATFAASTDPSAPLVTAGGAR